MNEVPPTFVRLNHYPAHRYLYKVPQGYDCHANTGIALPALV